MAGNNKKIYVYAHWTGLGEPQLMGLLSATFIRGKEVFSFVYDEAWLKAEHTESLDPDLQLYGGTQYNQTDKPNFGLFLDSSPDRWGRVLMKRREAIMARKEGRKPATLFESDFLLGVYDEYRMGGLRFKTAIAGDFLNAGKHLATPPWSSLRELEQASLRLESEEKQKDEEALRWLNMLLAPGASLGGARPKASIRSPDGQLWIAKFPSGHDEHNVGAWEMVASQLAAAAGLRVPAAEAKKFSGSHHTFLAKRFDRTVTGERIHFASAMTLLGYNDGADFHTGASYLELAGYLIQHGSNTAADLKELWTRIAFNICVKNTDDHLRNHGFLLTQSGWTLSPVYDVNPFPDGTGLTLNISEDDNALDLDLALSVSGYFRLKPKEARQIAGDVKVAVSNWQRLAKQMGIPASEQALMGPAFHQV